MALLDRFRRKPEERATGISPYSFSQWLAETFSYNGNLYAVTGNQTLQGSSEPISSTFSSLVAQVYKSNGVVFAPIPDPTASFRGMSWLTPVLREIQADNYANDHKQASFVNGATPNMIINFGEGGLKSIEKFEELKAKFREEHEGAANAYRTLF